MITLTEKEYGGKEVFRIFQEIKYMKQTEEDTGLSRLKKKNGFYSAVCQE